MTEYSLQEISQIVGGILTEVENVKVSRLGPPLLADENTLALAFSEEEIEFLCNNGAKAVTLGNRILRAETASIAISSVLMFAFGEWDKWKQF